MAESFIKTDGVTGWEAAVSSTNPLPVSATIDTTGLATSAGQAAGNTSLASILAALGQPLSVTGNFYQTTQPVSGSVAVSNFPATQAVTGTFFQATQPVSGTFWQATQPVSLAALPALVAGSANIGHVTIDNASLAVTGAFYQATQPVSGTFFQATQPVSIASMPSTPVTGTFWQATQPVSAAALPLPSGAATAVGITALTAKTPAPGTAGSASSDVISVQGVASMTALKVDGSAVTQPVSGTVTANAGTNMGTASLALEAGGNLAALVSQGANDLPANRTLVTLSALLATGATTEALLTLIANKGGVNQSGATSYTVTSGKTLRLTGLHVDVLNTTTVANRVQINVRAVNGTVSASSPIVGRLMAASQAALAASGGSDDISFPEGVCIPAGWQVGISQICTVTTAATVSVVLTGYEY